MLLNDKPTKSKININSVKKNYELYLFILLPVIYFITFCYVPMYGITIAFKDFIPSKGITGSPWVGLEHFKDFFASYYFSVVLKNTIGISFFSIIAGFPLPIILAIMLNEVKTTWFKKSIQMITYAPHFISTVVICGMLVAFLSPQSGIINNVVKSLGGTPKPFLEMPEYFWTIFITSNIWQGMGWGCIIYLAALSNVDPELHEAATIDGANRIQRIVHINIPAITPTIIIILIMSLGSVMSVGFEKIFLLQNSLNIETSEVISTYVYKSGLVKAQYSFASAVGLFNSVINFFLLVSVNFISKKANQTSLW